MCYNPVRISQVVALCFIMINTGHVIYVVVMYLCEPLLSNMLVLGNLNAICTVIGDRRRRRQVLDTSSTYVRGEENLRVGINILLIMRNWHLLNGALACSS